METLIKQNDLKIIDESTIVSDKQHFGSNPGLRALLSIKKFTAILENDYAHLIEVEVEFDNIFKEGFLMIEKNCEKVAQQNWEIHTEIIKKAITEVNSIISEAKETIEKKEKEDIFSLWSRLAEQIQLLREHAKKSVDEGLNMLPENLHIKWQTEFIQVQETLLQSVVSHVESCRVLLQMIERYTPDELNRITQIIVDQVPLDFTYEEAVLYQKDYFKALVNFKKEFKEEKNLWDKFLDILAGGTHQPPSERVMMERWLDGEKGDLQ